MGKNTIVVDDSLQSGLKAFRAIHLLRKAGFEPLGVFVVVDWGQGGAEKLTARTGAPVYSVCTLPDMVSHYRVMGDIRPHEQDTILQYLSDNRY